ncbi:MAG: molybdopterin-dependent oxidoreductase [Candidatus Bathyarchaeia archaeon]
MNTFGRYVWFECADGYITSLNIEELSGDDVLLAYRLNGEELPSELGGPVRLVVPDRYAYKSPMWIARITFTDTKEPGFWDREAIATQLTSGRTTDAPSRFS